MSTKPPAGLLFVLWCAIGVGPLLSYGLSTTSSLVIEDLGISESQFGLLATVTFFTASLTALWLGKLADRVSERTALLIIFGGAAASMLVAALSHSYVVLIAAMIVSGGAQAMANPGTNRVVMRLDPPHKRPGRLGLKQSGVQGAQLFAGIFFPAVALLAGWQGAAAAAAVVIMILAFFAARQVPAPAVDARRRSTTTAGTGSDGVKENPGRLPGVVWAYAATAFATGVGIQATNVYLPLFAQRDLGFSLLLAGLTAALAGSVGMVSRVSWGRAMSLRRNGFSVLLILACGAAAGALLLLSSAPAGQAWMLWVGTFLHGATALAVNVVVMAGAIREVPKARVGATSGVVSMGMYVGFGIGPLAMGLLLQLFGGFQAGWSLVLAAYLLCAVICFVARLSGKGSSPAHA
ncbi:MFS transporter [Arthrobacter castelli]|uniref:MFS transporter n=1 Tax=Arthrobacter castelli TaxID=271431 RepID=UPI00041343B2|nr:MFS transporter [Arthrobacter castelli]